MDYWEECIRISFEEAGIEATEEQILIVVDGVEGGHENYGMAHGYDCISNPLEDEVKSLKHNLRREQEADVCPECKGSGRYVSYGPYHSSESDCYKCRGSGKIYYSKHRQY